MKPTSHLRRLARNAQSLILAAGLLGPAHAIDLGHYGPVYPIAEPDFIESLTASVQSRIEDGTWDRIKREAETRVLDSLAEPQPVPGLVRAEARRSWLHDPSIVLSESITDGAGRILFPAGYRVNPLETVDLPEPLLFFDGRDEAQIAAAVRLIDAHEGVITPILVAGSWQKLGIAWQRQVFFDQHGLLVERLGIRAVPALVTQDGLALRIEELDPEDVP